jgi:hypothetical protein
VPEIETTTADGQSVRLRRGVQVCVNADLREPHPRYAGRTGTVTWLLDPAEQRFSAGLAFDDDPCPVWFAPDEVTPLEAVADGVEVDVALPSAVSAQEVQARRQELAQKLGRHQHEVSTVTLAGSAVAEPTAIQAAAAEAAEALLRLFDLAREDCTVQGPVEALDALIATGGPLNVLSEGIDALKGYLSGFDRAEDCVHDEIDSAVDWLDLADSSVDETIERLRGTATCLRELT